MRVDLTEAERDALVAHAYLPPGCADEQAFLAGLAKLRAAKEPERTWYARWVDQNEFGETVRILVDSRGKPMNAGITARGGGWDGNYAGRLVAMGATQEAAQQAVQSAWLDAHPGWALEVEGAHDT